MIATATCPKCGYQNGLTACQNCGGTDFRRGPLNDGSTGMICNACNLGFSHTPCQNGCGAMVSALAFGTPVSRVAGGIKAGMDAYQGKSCFIATELYGSDSAQVATLRRFRDQTLSKSPIGAALVAAYYQNASWLIQLLRRSVFIRVAIRALVAVCVRIARSSLTIAAQRAIRYSTAEPQRPVNPHTKGAVRISRDRLSGT